MPRSAQPLCDPFRDLRQRGRQCRAVIATTLRQVRTPAALAAEAADQRPEQRRGVQGDVAAAGDHRDRRPRVAHENDGQTGLGDDGDGQRLEPVGDAAKDRGLPETG